MAVDNIYYKVKLYLEANSKTETEFDSNITLQNDGSGLLFASKYNFTL